MDTSKLVKTILKERRDKAGTRATRQIKRVMLQKKLANCSFYLFCDDVRSEVLKEHPEAKMVEVSNLLKARWSALDAAEKGRYEALACDKLNARVA